MYQLVNNGDVPDENYFNGLMKQSVIVCTSGTRPSSPPEGMFIYETDTDRYSAYNGTAWITFGQTITSTYTPALTGGGGNPNLGTSPVQQGRYTLFNGLWCTVRGTIQFGTGAPTSGSGQYFVSLPFTANNSITAGVPFCGAAYIRDSSSSAIAQALVYAGGGATTFSLVASNATVTATAPWTWAASDYISWTLTYEIA